MVVDVLGNLDGGDKIAVPMTLLFGMVVLWKRIGIYE
jgi:hypothetical protein